MKMRYFRYLFEKQGEGLFHSGCIYDKAGKDVLNYIYMGGIYGRRPTLRVRKKQVQEKKILPEKIHLLIIYGYTIEYIKEMIRIIEESSVETIILPYLAPVQRLVIGSDITGNSDEDKEVIRFLEDPYLYLKSKKIANIYFLYGNGGRIDRPIEEQLMGDNFELADTQILRLVKEMEGYTVPVVKAGFRIQCDWIFYLGVYGRDLYEISKFTREFFQQNEEVQKEQEMVKLLVRAYTRKFGMSPVNSIVLYHGPVYDKAQENDSVMFQHEFSRHMRCQALLGAEKSAKSCEIRCAYEKDHTAMQGHKRKDRQYGKYGAMLLGNANMNRFLPEIAERFYYMKGHTRVLTVPNAAAYEDWNHRVLELSEKEDRIYFIGVQHQVSSSTVLADIVSSCPMNKYLPIDEEYGCCFSGYLVPKNRK